MKDTKATIIAIFLKIPVELGIWCLKIKIALWLITPVVESLLK